MDRGEGRGGETIEFLCFCVLFLPVLSSFRHFGPKTAQNLKENVTVGSSRPLPFNAILKDTVMVGRKDDVSR